ncbi:Beta-propeller domains of methanol dehydrogenase type [Lysobacter capsici AZ78]|uniref:Beta-propeller domains of methanol dehydrogenase type n=1 Tax=Lysobacter capsici AZ78 TaxID=1444315 RepID=A0A120AHX6_9GAMM|nr:TPM domain-containing protein [Lysobacter capsici]KWS06863.1 Beta-propeller domains of methanol dehydrogenase type [Lysobacter capsici AZ78]
MNTRADPRMGFGRARWLARVLLVAWLLLLPMASALAQTLASIPAMDSPVVDTTGTLDEPTRSQLAAQARALQQRKGSQLQILMVDSTGSEDIDSYALRAFDQFELGRKDVSDGVLVVVAKRDKRVRIEVGYGLEGAITDAQAATIIRDYIGPRFGAGDYAGGLREATAALTGLIDGEALPPPPEAPVAGVGWRPLDTAWSLAFVFALGAAAFARTREWPRAMAWPLAWLPPLLFAWMWSGIGSVGGAAAFAAAGVAIGHCLPRQRWLRIAMTVFAIAVVIAIGIVFAWYGREPNLLGIVFGLALELFAAPLLAGVLAPPIIAWDVSRVGCVIRALLFLPLAWLGWQGMLAAQRWAGMEPGIDMASGLLLGVVGMFAWAGVFVFGPRRGGSRQSAPGSSSSSRDYRSSGTSSSTSSSSSGGSSSSGWSGGGGRSGGGGASGSW